MFVLRLLLAFSLVAPLAAQSVVAGDLGPQTATTVTGPATLIDLNAPASAGGNLTTATVRWDGGGTACSAGFQLRFFRSVNNAIGLLTLVGERGPFATPASSSLVTVALNPAVTVQKGDLLGVFVSAGCGGVAADGGSPQETMLSTTTNYAGGALPAAAKYVRGVDRHRCGGRRGVRREQLEIPYDVRGVESQRGDDPAAAGVSPRGTHGHRGDIPVTVEVEARATRVLEFSDAFLPAGLGTIDVYSTAEPAPQINARVYNDTGAGTNGFNEAMLRPGDALHAGEAALIVAPPDLAAARMNVGIRTLDEPTSVEVFVRADTGLQFCSFGRDYQPRFFEQLPLQPFLGVCGVENGYSAVVRVVSGTLFLYTTTTDNRTNDSAITIARRR